MDPVNDHAIAVYTGVFDPVHLGHLDVIRRGRPIAAWICNAGERSGNSHFIFGPSTGPTMPISPIAPFSPSRRRAAIPRS